MKFWALLLLTLLIFVDANATPAPQFQKTYQPNKGPLILPAPDKPSNEPIPSNSMDNFILALASCNRNVTQYTPYGPNRIIGMEHNRCHVTFTLSGLLLDCLLPQKVMLTLDKGIDVNRYCSQSRLPLLPSQQTLLKLLNS